MCVSACVHVCAYVCLCVCVCLSVCLCVRAMCPCLCAGLALILSVAGILVYIYTYCIACVLCLKSLIYVFYSKLCFELYRFALCD